MRRQGLLEKPSDFSLECALEEFKLSKGFTFSGQHR
jgi:hypothetical protein